MLAFDDSCGKCRAMSRAIERACAARLEMMPLAHPDVRKWREQSLGSRAPWVPTLIRVADEVRAWTGLAMGIVLVRHLGALSTMRVLEALGRQRRARKKAVSEQTDTRLQAGSVLVSLWAGLFAVVGLMMTTLSGGEGSEGEDPHAWVNANRDRLPQSYDDFAGHSMPYRRAIYTELPPAVRSQLWVDQLNRFRSVHPQLSADQTAVIDDAIVILSGESAFEPANRSGLEQIIEQHRESAIAAFGRNEANDLFGTLGPPDESFKSARRGDCVCHHRDDAFCPSGQVCQETDACKFRAEGCGWWWEQPCDGLCYE